MSNQHLFASALVAISAIMYGFLGYLGTSALQDHFSLSSMLFWRFLIAGTWMLVFAIKKNSLRNLFSTIDNKMLWLMFVFGALAYAGSSEFYFIASRYTGTGLAMVIFFSYPMLIAVLSWITKKGEFSFITLLTLIAMVLGLVLLQDSRNTSINMVGILFGIFAAVCYAAYVVGSKYFVVLSRDTNIVTMLVCFGSATYFLVYSLIQHELQLPQHGSTWLKLLTLGVVATAIPIQLMLEGLKHLSSIRASIITVLEPLVTIMMGVFFLNEHLTSLQLFGAVIILTSALLVQLQKSL